MSKVQVQNAISFSKFNIIGCNFTSSPDVSSDDLKNVKISFEFGTGFSESEKSSFVVNFTIKINSVVKSRLSLTVKAECLFRTKDEIDDVFIDSHFAKINAPAIAFPFLRSFIQTLCVNAGIPPIVLPSYNFAKAVDEAALQK